MGNVTKMFGKRLKELRETAGFTQQELADELKVSRGAISYYEKGERTPDIEFLDNLSMYFNLPFDFLLGHTDNAKEEHAYMYEFYGLTDEAFDILDGDPCIGHIISYIITHNDFYGLEKLIKAAVKNYKEFDYSKMGYISFLITDCLTMLIDEALRTELYNQYTVSEKEEIIKKWNESGIKFNETMKELDRIEKEFQIRNKVELDKDVEKYKSSKEYIARKKIMEKYYDGIHFAEANRKKRH